MKNSAILIFLVIALSLPLAGCTKGGAVVTKTAPAIAFVVCLDVSDSVQPERYATMRDEIITGLVFSRIRQGDVIHFLQCGEDSSETPKLFVSQDGTPMHRLYPRLGGFYENIVKPVQSRHTHATDLMGALAYAERLYHSEAGTPTPHRIEVLILTDGKPEGLASALPGLFPKEVNVGFWAIDAPNEKTLDHWAKTDAKLADGQYQIVLFSQWQNAEAAYAQRLGRPRNPNAVKALAQHQARASGL